MVCDLEALGLGHGLLPGLDFCVVKLLDPTAVQTHHVVMVLPFIELVDRFATFEMVAAQNAGLFKLGQHPVHRGQTDVGIFLEQLAKNILCGHVSHRPALENFQDFQARQGGFEAVVFQFIDLTHGLGVSCWRPSVLGQSCRYNDPDHIGTHPTMTVFQRFCFSGRALATALLALGLAGCGGLTGSLGRDTFKPYVPEVVQGNFISKEQRQVLRPGMARVQVREVLGTPLVASLFHADRWDYAFSIQRQGVPPQNFRLTVHFKGDVLDRIEGDELPSESEFASRLIKPRSTGKLPPLQASEEDLKKFSASPTPRAASVPAPATATALPRTYPPLEPEPR